MFIISERSLSLTYSLSLSFSLSSCSDKLTTNSRRKYPKSQRESHSSSLSTTHLARTMGVARLARMMALAALLLQLNHADAYSSTYTPCCTLSIVFVSFVLSLLCPFCNFQSVRSIAPPLSLSLSLFLFFFLSLSLSIYFNSSLCVF